MKTIDLTFFNEIWETDFYRIAEKERETIGKVEVKVKITKYQEDLFFKTIHPNWFDGRTRDGKSYKKRSIKRKIPTIKIYETDFGPIEMEIV